MRAFLVWFLALAALVPQAGLGLDRPPRELVFECPCSATFTPDEDDGRKGSVHFRFGVRSFRDTRSMAVHVHFQRRSYTFEWINLHSYGASVVPSLEDGIAAMGAVRDVEVRVDIDGEEGLADALAGGEWLVASLAQAERPGGAPFDIGRWRINEFVRDDLVLWPVPGARPEGPIHYVDILTDTDGDGVGDVNEWLAGGWRPGGGLPAPDPASDAGLLPEGDSEVDVLWLYQQSLAATDLVAEYRHATKVAGFLFEDSGANIRLRPVGFVAVPEDAVGGEVAYVDGNGVEHKDNRHPVRLDPDLYAELAERHGADVVHLMLNDETHPLCGARPPGAGCALIGSAGAGGHRFLLDDRQAASASYSRLSAYTIAHELGHVMGLAHSARQAEWHGSFRWSRGHYVGGWGPRPHYGTIMSYGYATLTPVFSSPASDRCRPWGACGLPATHPHGADAVRSLDLVRFQVAAVRGRRPDSDGDGFVDAADAFPEDPAEWADLDGDGIGGNADADEWADLDGDGVGDDADPDRDGDGVDNGDDLFPDDALDHADADGDGVGDNAQRLHPFRDEGLRAVVERALGKAEGAPISDAEMAGIKALESDGADVMDLTGLELATGLTRLRLGMDERGFRGPVSKGGGVADLSPLAGLGALETAWLAMSTRLADLSPLSGLSSLTSLRLDGDWLSPGAVSGLRALESLPLTELAVRYAAVSDASPLSGMTKLETLDLAGNRIGDISSLAGLSKLRGLNLWHNELLSDISPLSALTELTWLTLGHTRVADISPLAGLSKLRQLHLPHNLIADISPLVSLSLLTHLDVSENGIEHVAALAALAGLRALGIGGNPLSFSDFLAAFQPGPGFQRLGLSASNLGDLTPLARLMERAGARAWDLDLSSNPFTDLSPLVRPEIWDGGGQIDLLGVSLDREAAEAHVAELASMGVAVTGYEPAPDDAPKAVDVPDVRLSRLLHEAAAASSEPGLVDDPPTPGSLAGISRLHAFGQGIADLAGLEAATGLEHAHLASNRISDLSPLLGLESLKGVDLDGNPLTEAALNEQVPELMTQVASASCGSREPACGTVTLNAVSWTPVAGGDGTARFRTGGYFAARLGVADASGIAFAASADREALRPSVSADGLLTTRPARLAGPATVTVTAEAAGADPAALDFLIISPKGLPLFLADGALSGRHGFLRVVNHSGRAGDVRITAKDGSGGAFGPVFLSLEGHQAIHLNSQDLENGNPAKGLRGGLGDGQGDWRLTLEGRLNAEALAYVRTADGFVTAMHDIAPKAEDGRRELLFFNPGSNNRQESVLRLFNDSDEAGSVRITGIDDAGAEGFVTADLPAGEAVRFTAAELEDGAAPGLSGALGDGTGKWRLRIEAGPDVTAMGLLETPTGHLANLSAPPPAHDGDGIVRIPLFLSASEPSREGFMRVVNRSDREGAVSITAFDDTGAEHGPVNLSLSPREARHFNSGDLESGNLSKGLDGSTGAGRGHWRLELDGGGLDFEALAYVRTNDGFVTAMHEVAPSAGGTHRIAFLNPGSNHRQESVLRLANSGGAPASVTVTAVDDAGSAGRSPITLELPSGHAMAVTAKALEDGLNGLSGSLGDGRGKWRLCVEASPPLTAMSLLETPTGHLTNLSGSPDLANCTAGAPEG